MDLFAKLPVHLAERSRWISQNKTSDGFGVVYWMRTAVRIDENPALDVAKAIAKELNQPLLIYHGLSCRYPFASDRHHAFILQGARDVQAACREAGLSYAFYLERNRQSEHALRGLAETAQVIVTEDMPTDPARRFVTSLKSNSKLNLLAVDTACIAPMRLVGKAYERAFEFRNATRRLYSARLTKDWPQSEVDTKPYPLDRLTFPTVDFRQAKIEDLIAECDIDHAVGPIPDTIGGTANGYMRWMQFCSKGLTSYAKRRNDPTIDSVSRMSAYLHYGMVSPFRIAREAADYRSEGAEKFLDELLIWRELSYAFCFYRNDHDRISSIPDWAQKTLAQHESDHRPEVLSWEQLARGKTGDLLWDAAQQSMLIQGELHNNVRMTWGKSLVKWTKDAKSALRLMLDLNHRYALDGRDPNSYGGILWCLGQFDRPFFPEQNIYGTVRTRETAEHLARMDFDKYHHRVSRPRLRVIPKVAVLGAGMSGSIAARTLHDHGLEVTVFEKSHSVGGRMATRRKADRTFDHGAQYFTARNKDFQRYAESWVDQGIVEAWNPTIAVFDADDKVSISRSTINRYVGSKNMGSVSQHLLTDIPTKLNTRIGEVISLNQQFQLREAETSNDLGTFDYVISSIPAPQSAELFRFDTNLAAQLQSVTMNPCWALMIEFKNALQVKWDAAFVNTSFVRWIARNGTKPNRSSEECVVVHAAFDWSLAHLESEPQVVEQELLEETLKLLHLSKSEVESTQIHRWRYAISESTTPLRYLTNNSGLLACGDWAAGAKIEGAFLSGLAAAGAVMRRVMT